MSDEPRDRRREGGGPTPQERAWLAAVPERVEPPPALRDRVVDRLTSAGELSAGPGPARGSTASRASVLAGRSPRAAVYRTVAAAAGLVLAFLAGGLAGRLTAGAPGGLGGGEAAAGGVAGGPSDGEATGAPPAGETIVEASPRFVLLLYEDEGFLPGRSVEQLVEEYGGWARGLAEEGALVLAEKLSGDARVVPARDGAGAAPDAPFPATALAGSNGPGTLTGFFIVRAADYEEAARMARASPHAGYGGRVVVRRIDPT